MTRTRLPGPRGPGQLLLLRRLLRDPAPVLDELNERYGGVCGLGAGPLRMAIVGDPAALSELFAAPVDDFRWAHRLNVLAFVVGDGSMIVSDGPDHRRRRSSVKSAFSRRRLNGWIPTILEQTDIAVGRLPLEPGRTEQVDLAPIARRLVLEVVVRAFFGERLAARAEEIGDLFQSSQDYLESPAVRQLPHPFPFTRRARVRSDRVGLDRLIDSEISACRRDPTGDPLDVLEALVQDGSLTDSEIRDQVVTLIGAGFDTTSASLRWMLCCAPRCEGLWGSLRAEADQEFGPITEVGPDTSDLGAAESGAIQPARVDPTILSRLVVADRVMHETLRLHPAGIISPREAACDVCLGDQVIRRRTIILWSAHLAGRSPEAWTDPLEFDPDRFADPTPEQRSLARSAWVPFGGGARNCVGFMLAQMELTLVISRFTQHLDLTPLDARVPPPVGMVVNRPSGGVPMRVSLRDRSAPRR